MTFDQWFDSICTAPAYVHFMWLDRAMRELEAYLEFSSLSAAEREEYIGTDGDIACGVFVATHLPVFCGKVLWPGLDDVTLRRKWYQIYLKNTPDGLSEERFLDAVRCYTGCSEPLPLEYQFDGAIFTDSVRTETSRIRRSFGLTCMASVQAAVPLFFDDASRFGEPHEITPPFVKMFGMERIKQEARKYYARHLELAHNEVKLRIRDLIQEAW